MSVSPVWSQLLWMTVTKMISNLGETYIKGQDHGIIVSSIWLSGFEGTVTAYTQAVCVERKPRWITFQMSSMKWQHRDLKLDNRPLDLRKSIRRCSWHEYHDMGPEGRQLCFQNLKRDIMSSHRQHEGVLKRDRPSVLRKQWGISCSYIFVGERYLSVL